VKTGRKWIKGEERIVRRGEQWIVAQEKERK
jgi:hypothetical protein